MDSDTYLAMLAKEGIKRHLQRLLEIAERQAQHTRRTPEEAYKAMNRV